MKNCIFDKAWVGKCKLPCNDEFCEKHIDVKCQSCGNQANRECDHTGQFVCGFLLCKDCEGFTDSKKASGSWGFMNHTHRKMQSVIK